MTENRRIRFNDIEGFTHSDLSIASEVWLDDICSSRWSTAEVQKVAAILYGWMRDHQLAEAEALAIEDKYRLTREEVQRAFNQLKLFGCIETFTFDRNGIRAAARLSMMQKVRVFDTRQKYREHQARAADEAAATEAAADSRWAPQPEPAADAMPAAAETAPASKAA